MNFKKMIALVLVMVLTAAVTFGATVAFLTDETEIKPNVFTIGNVDIEITEKVSDTSNGKATETSEGAQYVLVAPGDKLEKEVVVSNKGLLDAYVAVTVKLNNADKINAAIDEMYEGGKSAEELALTQAVYDEVFEGWGINYNPRPGANGVSDARGVIDGAGSVWKLPEEVLQVDFAKTVKGSTVIGATNWFIAGREKAGQYWVDGPGAYDGFYTKDMNDYEICYTYYIKLDAGKSVTLFEGLNVPDYFVGKQMEMFNNLTIDISGAAIQADNFATPKEAFEALYAQPTPVEPDVYDAVVSNSEELAAAISGGKTNIYMNAGTYAVPAAAKGKTLALSGAGAETVIEVVPAGQGEAGGQLDYSLDGSKVTFNNLTIKTNSQLYAGFARLSATYNNCVIQNTYNVGVGNSVFNNCVFNITNEYLRVGGAYSVAFNGCTFNTDGRAILVFQDGTNHAQTVTVKDCTFNATAAAHTWNGIHVAAVSIDGTNGTYTVNLEGNNVADANFNGLWQIKAGEAHVTVND